MVAGGEEFIEPGERFKRPGEIQALETVVGHKDDTTSGGGVSHAFMLVFRKVGVNDNMPTLHANAVLLEGVGRRESSRTQTTSAGTCWVMQWGPPPP